MRNDALILACRARGVGGGTHAHLRPRRGRAIALVAVIILLAGCGRAQAGAIEATAAPTHVASGKLPAFADWRAAYIGSDSHLHVVSLDGKTDTTGPDLAASLAAPGLAVETAGASPDGHLIQYASPGVTLVDVAEAGTRMLPNTFGSSFSWSPDSRSLASTEGQGISLFDVPTGRFSTVPLTDWLVNPSIVGWLDTGHIGVMVYAQPSQIPLCTPCSTPNPNPPPLSLVSVDVGTGKARIIFTVSAVNLGSAEILLSPDRTQALLVNHRFRDEPFTPRFELVDLATGTLRSLPNLTKLGQGVDFGQIAWRPGAPTVATSVTAFGPGTDWHTQQWLIDLAHDVVTRFTAPGFVMGWSPDGSTLVTSTGYQAALGSGPFDLNAVTFSPSGQAAVALLTHDERSFPFLGFVRNP